MNKKGISEIISYTLLIIIALALSALVFGYLKVYIPKYQTPECPAEISVSVKNVECSNQILNLELVNKGFFSIDSVFVRLSPPGSTVKTLLPGDGYKSLSELKPNNSTSLTFALSEPIASTSDNYTLEVQPAIFDESGDLAICSQSVSNIKISCSA